MFVPPVPTDNSDIRYIRVFHPLATRPKTLFLMVAGRSECDASRDPHKAAAARFADAPLSPAGTQEALRLGKRCRFMHVVAEAKVVVSSPLTRAVQTAGLALGATNVVKRDFSFGEGFFGRAGGRAERGDGGISTRYVVCRHLAEVGADVSCRGRPVAEVVQAGEPGVRADQWNVHNALGGHWCDAASGRAGGLLPVVDFAKRRLVVVETPEQGMARAAAAWAFLLALPEQRVAVVSHTALLALLLSTAHFALSPGGTGRVAGRAATAGPFKPPGPCDVVVVHVTGPVVQAAFVSQERPLPWFTPNSVDRVDLGDPFLEDDDAEAAARQHGGEAVPGDEEPITCCFIVLGHCLLEDGAPTSTHRKRIKAAARAFKEYALTDELARPCIIVTGANSAGRSFADPGRQWNEEDAKETEAEAAREILEEFYKIPKRYVLVEDFSTNTAEAAVNCIPVLRSVGFPPDVRLVTSDYHMPRALALFETVFSMEPAYAYEAICGMAQKAGALITPVVARNGCAEDLQEMASRRRGGREARARRAEHHAPKLRLRLARELELVSDLRAHYKGVFHLHRLFPGTEQLTRDRAVAALLTQQLESASGVLPSSSRQYITAPPPPQLPASAREVQQRNRYRRNSGGVGGGNRGGHSSDSDASSLSFSSAEDGVATETLSLSMSMSMSGLSRSSHGGGGGGSSAGGGGSGRQVTLQEVRVKFDTLRRVVDRHALPKAEYQRHLAGRELVVLCSQQTAFDAALALGLDSARKQKHAKSGGKKKNRHKHGAATAAAAARRHLDTPLTPEGRAWAGGELRSVVRAGFHRQQFRAIDKVVCGSNMAALQTAARVFGSGSALLAGTVCPLFDARVDGFAALARPLGAVVREDEKVAACRWKFSLNRRSVPLNEWNHEDNCDAHVLLVAAHHGDNDAAGAPRAHLAEYANGGGGAAVDGDGALFAAALNAHKGGSATAFWTMAPGDGEDGAVQPYEDRASFKTRLRQAWAWLLEEFRRYPDGRRMAIVAHPSWVLAFVALCQGERPRLSGGGGSGSDQAAAKTVFHVKFR